MTVLVEGLGLAGWPGLWTPRRVAPLSISRLAVAQARISDFALTPGDITYFDAVHQSPPPRRGHAWQTDSQLFCNFVYPGWIYS